MSKQDELSQLTRFQREVRVLVQAGENLVWVDTYELERSAAEIHSVVQDITHNNLSPFIVFRWDSLFGFKIIYKDNHAFTAIETGAMDKLVDKDNPVSADSVISAIVSFLSSVGKRFSYVFILDNFHLYLNGDVHNVSQMAKLNEFLKELRCTVVVNSSTVSIPDELTKYFTVIDLDYPSIDMIEEIVNNTFEDFATSGKKVKFSKAEKVQFIQAFSGLTIDEIESTLCKLMARETLLGHEISIDSIKWVLDEKKQILKKQPLLEPIESPLSFDDVGGYDNLKTWLTMREKAYSENAKSFGLPTPRGVFLIGLPGTGKSLSAKALANLLHQPLYRLDFGSMFGKLVGQSEENLRKALRLAEVLSPCVLWVDEIDKSLSNTSGSGDSGTSSRVFAYFLTWLQEKKSSVFTVCTANDMRMLQTKPELLRSGRFDEKFYLDLPNSDERTEILRVHLKKANVTVPEKGYSELAELTENFSGAEIEQAINDAKHLAFYEDEDDPKVKRAHLVKAITETIPLFRSMEEQIKFNRTWATGRFKRATSKVDAPADEKISKGQKAASSFEA